MTAPDWKGMLWIAEPKAPDDVRQLFILAERGFDAHKLAVRWYVCEPGDVVVEPCPLLEPDLEKDPESIEYPCVRVLWEGHDAGRVAGLAMRIVALNELGREVADRLG